MWRQIKALFESSTRDAHRKSTLNDIVVCHEEGKKCFQVLRDIFRIADAKKVARKPSTHTVAVVSRAPLAALGDVWCPCAEGQGQQRRACVTEEWTAEESALPSAESAEHTRVGEGEPARGCGLVKHATPRRASACESRDK